MDKFKFIGETTSDIFHGSTQRTVSIIKTECGVGQAFSRNVQFGDMVSKNGNGFVFDGDFWRDVEFDTAIIGSLDKLSLFFEPEGNSFRMYLKGLQDGGAELSWDLVKKAYLAGYSDGKKLELAYSNR